MDTISKWLLSPPFAFMILLFFCWLFSFLFSKFSYRPDKYADGTSKPYACGEEDYNHSAQPDYSTFFPFAFFFTLAHVTTLIIATTPAQTATTFAIAVIYITGAILGLFILLRR